MARSGGICLGIGSLDGLVRKAESPPSLGLPPVNKNARCLSSLGGYNEHRNSSLGLGIPFHRTENKVAQKTRNYSTHTWATETGRSPQTEGLHGLQNKFKSNLAA